MIDATTTILLILYGVVMFGAGVMFRKTLKLRRPQSRPPDEQQTILVKRTRPSFRHPGKTQTTAYDEFKTSKGLYAPVRPGKGSTADEIDTRD
jgi:hypothetical protein